MTLRFLRPKQQQCYKCPMPGIIHCEYPRCARLLCLRHRVRKAGGNLCVDHADAKLVQEEAVPSRFKAKGDAVPHVDE